VKKEYITCPNCDLQIEITTETKSKIEDRHFKTVINAVNKHLTSPLILTKIIRNTFCSYMCEVETKAKRKDIVKLNDLPQDSHIGPIPALYKGEMMFGGIGPITLHYDKKSNEIVVYDPVPDIKVVLRIKEVKK